MVHFIMLYVQYLSVRYECDFYVKLLVRKFSLRIDDICMSRYLELETAEFELGSMMDAVVSQGMITSREKGLQLIRETPREVQDMCLFGDQVRLQQVLADFLLNAVRFTPSSEGWVGIKVVPTMKRLGGGFHVVHLEFRFVFKYFLLSAIVLYSSALT